MATTIRKNSLTRIKALVEGMVLCYRYQDDGMDARNTRLTAAEVMELAPRFEHVYLRDNGGLSIGICSTVDFISCYPSREVAKACLTDYAFNKYFPTN